MSQKIENQIEKGVPQTWEEILDEGLERHESAKHEDQYNQYTEIGSVSEMEIDEVWLAIGSIWDGIRRAPGGVVYAYGDVRLLEYKGTQQEENDNNPVPGPRQRFIVPLILGANYADQSFLKKNNTNEISESTNHIGHFMLAVAQIQSKDGQDQIQLEFYDSRIGTESEADIRSRTELIIQNSQWLCSDSREASFNLSYAPDAPEDFLVVPQQAAQQEEQTEGINECGLYTILNAWAVMLEIPVRRYPCRRGNVTHDEFVTQGLRIINLVLAGHMDSRTIQAFFNVYGYCKPQNAMDKMDHVRHGIKIDPMYAGRLDLHLRDQVHREMRWDARTSPTPPPQWVGAHQ